MFSHESATLKPLELLDLLRGYPFLERYALALFHERDGVVTRLGPVTPLCGALARNSACLEKCEPAYESAVKIALENRKPTVFSCRAGLMNFAVPYGVGNSFRYCLVGGGVRTPTLDLFLAEKLAKSDKIDGFTLLELLEELPAVTPEELGNTAREVTRLLEGMTPDTIQARLLEKNTEMFRSVRGILSYLEMTSNVPELKDFLGETLGIVFGISRVAVGLLPDREKEIPLRGLRGMVKDLGVCTEKQLAALFPHGDTGPVLVPEREMTEYFSSVVAEKAFCLPIARGKELLGLLVFFDEDLNDRDTLLMGMITDRVASKVFQFLLEERHQRETSLSDKLKSALSAISSSENRSDLCLSILKSTADLLQASSGSLMLIDENGNNLRIESVLGMSRQLARGMNSRIGRGIAGKVAENGEPLLVKDIEQDSRVRIPNRSRFKTKSFISMPLRVKGSVIGVLNLSDKKNGDFFTEADLDLLATICAYSCVVMEKTEFSELAARLESEVLIDPLTGLYNHRFLEQRLDEELSRCTRQQLNLTLLLVDLDNFSVYNELCGYAAGDRALKKTARLLKDSARRMDIVTRPGGERFCVILPGASKDESFRVAERFRRKIERTGFNHEENLPLGRLTISIGIATAPHNGWDGRSLMSSADTALHRAKTVGRNRVVHFDSSEAKPPSDPSADSFLPTERNKRA